MTITSVPSIASFAPPQSVPGQGYPQNTSAAPDTSEMWKELGKRQPYKGTYVDFKSASDNCGVRCQQNSVVEVRTANGKAPIHANVIKFNENAAATSNANASSPEPRTAIAGQSPQSFALCENFLVQGLDSRHGLFQFVSRKAHAISTGRITGTSHEMPIIDQLLKQWKLCKNQTPPWKLGGLYEVEEIRELTKDKHHRRVMLIVKHPEKDGETIQVPLTQAGLQFTNRVLGVDQIEKANELMEAHKAFLPQSADSTQQPAADPLIASYAGIGRNATLITYREVRARIDALPDATACDRKWLDDNLKEVINAGRRDRGSRFIHSDAQLRELKQLLSKCVEQRNQNVQSIAPAL